MSDISYPRHFKGIIPISIATSLEELREDDKGTPNMLDPIYEALYRARSSRLGVTLSFSIDSAIVDTFIMDELKYQADNDLYAEAMTKQSYTAFIKKVNNWKQGGEFKSPTSKTSNHPQSSHYFSLIEQYINEAIALLQCSASPVIIDNNLLKEPGWYKVSMRKATSRGGFNNFEPKMHINLGGHISNRENTFHEYKRFSNSNVIGSFKGSIELRLKALIAHEMAHIAQYAGYLEIKGTRLNIEKDSLKRAHGFGFQEVYRYLREHMVNNQDGYTPF